MSDMKKANAPTAIGQFLAQKGMLLSKRFKYFGGGHCQYGTTLTIQSLVLSANLEERQEKIFGVKFEHEDQDQLTESCLVDFEELVELLRAIKHLIESGDAYQSDSADYTEVVYSTRDSMKVGFFQSQKDKQQAFFDVQPGGSTMFLTFEQLRSIFEAIKLARKHLIDAGAGQ